MNFKRKEVIGDCTLYLGDCLEITPKLQPVDCVITDPPYLLESGGNTTAEMGGKFARGVYDNSGAIVQTPVDWPDFMPVISQAIERGHIYVMANNRNIGAALKAGEKAGMRFHNILVWDKGTATPNRWYMKNLEFIGFFFKGKASHINDCGSKQLIKIPNVINGTHPTEKPVELMAHLIRNSTKSGDVILDPFMGSGTTGVACATLGRKFIGIELDEKHFETACQRIADAGSQSEMFA